VRRTSSSGIASPPSSTATRPAGAAPSPRSTCSSAALHSVGTPPKLTRSRVPSASSSAPGSVAVRSGSTHTASPRSRGGNSCRTCASKLSRLTSGSAKPASPSTSRSKKAR
jgi:hypothetical protein